LIVFHPPTHRHGKVKLAIASVFESGGVYLECQRSPVRGPHHDDEVERISVPASEETVLQLSITAMNG
jgi:hypothetical protein